MRDTLAMWRATLGGAAYRRLIGRGPLRRHAAFVLREAALAPADAEAHRVELGAVEFVGRGNQPAEVRVDGGF